MWVQSFTLSHTFENVNVTLELHSQLAPFHVLALVTSPKLRTWHSTNKNQPKCNCSIYNYMQLIVVSNPLEIFVITRPNFNYFGHFHNYDATIEIFILLLGWILDLFSSINRLICPINRNSHQINHILKVLYGDIEVYFYICIKITFIIWKFIIQFFKILL